MLISTLSPFANSQKIRTINRDEDHARTDKSQVKVSRVEV